MTFKTISTLFLVSLCFFVSGCATVLTTAYKPINETRHGDTVVGDQIGFSYAISEEKQDLLLLKQPLCRENIQLIKVERKQLHGVIPAILEMPFFGLGLLDLVVAGVITRASVEESPGEIAPGHHVVACGDHLPAARQPLVVQYPISVTMMDAVTDDAGRIPLKLLKPADSRDRQFTIFVREETGLSYVRTVDAGSW
ncbi:hypothetical protein JCM14469_29800 [Desulfatiferula olefinivorans]